MAKVCAKVVAFLSAIHGRVDALISVALPSYPQSLQVSGDYHWKIKVNGDYHLNSNCFEGTPVWQRGVAEDKDSLFLFQDQGNWVIARELGLPECDWMIKGSSALGPHMVGYDWLQNRFQPGLRWSNASHISVKDLNLVGKVLRGRAGRSHFD